MRRRGFTLIELLAATALAFFAMVAMSAIEGRGRAGLPDIVNTCVLLQCSIAARMSVWKRQV